MSSQPPPTSSSKPNWFVAEQVTLIFLFVIAAIIAYKNAADDGGSAFVILLALGVIGLAAWLVSLIIAAFANHAGKLKDQLIWIPVLHVALIVYAGFSISMVPETPSADPETPAAPTFEEYKASAIDPDPRALARTADSEFKGKIVHLTGTVIQVVGKGDELRVHLNDASGQESSIYVYVFRKDSAGTLLENDKLELWGTVLGNFTYTNLLGGETTAPSVQSEYLQLLSSAQPGSDASMPGSRSNPLPIGTEMTYNIQKTIEQYQATFKMEQAVRGDKAWAMIHKANPYNEPPSEGYEYLLVKLKVAIVNNAKPDAAVTINAIHFTLVSSSGKDYDSASVIAPEPELDASMYAGAENTGWAAFQVKTDDPHPLLAFSRNYDGTGGIWFKTD
ncbi:DUF4352 domain-containing protein [Cohnella caldifontis]|uniref:DUF4352 domain-containing protein n=1 Tax=Cohnella caldifontis TaxID=3027471 RepID=UPI0023EBB5FE|nr:DUF4352 domain-containing protein [Cohnella sp. YIM B05605]